MRIRVAATVAALLAVPLTCADKAQAQYYDFGLAGTISAMANQPSEVACQKGIPLKPNAVRATRQIAMNGMRAYWDALAAGTSPLGAFLVDKHVRWVSGTTVLDKKTIATLKDPWVAPGRNLVTEPLGYALSGDGLSALGQWQVRDESGAIIGTYEATFNMSKQLPRIATLKLIDPQTWVDPVEQYCHKPGDVMAYRLKLAREAAAFAAPRLAAAQSAEAAARARAEKARAAAAAAPGDAAKQEALRSAEAALALAANSTRPYQAMADQAKAELDAAQADKDRLDAKRAAWGAATAAASAADAAAKH